MSGTVREAVFHNGYGGTVVIESTIAGESVGVVVGHMLCDPACLEPKDASNPITNKPGCPNSRQAYDECKALQVQSNDSVVAGVTVLGIVGPRDDVQNGGYDPHVHVGIHRGTYNGSWQYWGYANTVDTSCALSTLKANWIDPATVIPCAAGDCRNDTGLLVDQDDLVTSAFRTEYDRFLPKASSPWCPVEVGDVPVKTLSTSGSRMVHPVSSVMVQDFCQLVSRKKWLSGSTDGLSAIIGSSGNAQAFDVHSGFWGTYKCLTVDGHQMGGADLLGAPTSDEYIPDGAGLLVSRQDFQRGFMRWGPSYTDSVCPTGGDCIHVHLNAQNPNVNVSTASDCVGATVIENPSGPPDPVSVQCVMGATTIGVTVRGPYQENLINGPVVNPSYLQFGYNGIDGTSDWNLPYATGTRDQCLWPADDGTCTLTLPLSERFNLFWKGDNVGCWFDLAKWKASGDCQIAPDGQGGLAIFPMRISPPPPGLSSQGTISCSGLQVTIVGPIQPLLVGGGVTSPVSIQCWSDSNGWDVQKPPVSIPWTSDSGAAFTAPAGWIGWNCAVKGSGGVLRWFDLVDADHNGVAWAVAGDCHIEGTKIVQ